MVAKWRQALAKWRGSRCSTLLRWRSRRLRSPSRVRDLVADEGGKASAPVVGRNAAIDLSGAAHP